MRLTYFLVVCAGVVCEVFALRSLLSIWHGSSRVDRAREWLLPSLVKGTLCGSMVVFGLYGLVGWKPWLTAVAAAFVVPPLVNALFHRVFRLKILVSVLNEAANENNALERRAAAEALAKLGDAAAVPALVKCLRDSSDEIRKTAATALTSRGWKPTEAEDRAFYLAAMRKFAEASALGDAAVPALLLAICDKSPDSSIRPNAAEAIVSIGPQAVTPLLNLLNDQACYCQTRVAAAKALGALGDQRAVASLVKALEYSYSKYSPLQEAAAIALGHLKSVEATPHLLALLSDHTKEVRKSAAEAIRKTDGPPPIGPFVERLCSTQGQSIASTDASGAARALGAIGDARAVAPLVDALQHSPVFDSELRADIAEALGDLGDRCAVGPLVEMLGDQRPKPRMMAAYSLGALKDGRATSALVHSLLNDRESAVREAAAFSLRDIGVHDATIIAALCQATLGDPDWVVRRTGAIALGRFGGPEAVKVLEKARKDENDVVQRVAEDGLVKLGVIPPPSLSDLISGKNDE